MKQKDLTLILVMVFIGVIVALVVSRLIFSSPKNREQTVEVVDVISSEFSEPPARYFNAESTNPTQQIEIGTGNNPNPFNADPE